MGYLRVFASVAVVVQLFAVLPASISWAQFEEENRIPDNAPEPEWGRLLRTPIFLEASTRLVNSIPLPSPRTRWSFPESAANQFPTWLTQCGLSAEVVTNLQRPERIVHTDGWIHLFPTIEEVLAIDPAVRSAVYTLLGQYKENEFFESPVLILTDTVEEWYKTAGLRPELVHLIARLACRRGPVWTFSDLNILISQAANENEARQVFKAFTRTRAYLVRLDIRPATDASRIKNYWTVGGKSWRLKDIEPLIESIQDSGEEVRLDLCHILPPLPRKLLYSYPGQEHAARGILPDCHWTSLNFFNYDPHDYLLDSRLATSKVLSEFDPVDPPYRAGDIVFILDKEGNAFHSCVYLAEDLVFTKNGRNQIVPWIISTLDDVTRVYLATSEGRLQAYRRRAELVQ